MRKLAGLLVVLCSAPLVQSAPLDSVVMIEYKSPAEYSAGSGTVVASEGGKSLIVSCAHVVPNGAGVITVTLNGKKFKAKYLFGTPVKKVVLPDGKQVEVVDGVDLSLIVVDEKLPAVEVASDPLKEGDRVRQWGYAGGPPFVKDGPYAKEGKVTDAEAVWATADARRGDSGCGLFNDGDQLAGVTSHRSVNPDEPGLLAVPLAKIRPFLKDNAKGFPLLQQKMK